MDRIWMNEQLLEWWATNKRDYPWRTTENPYEVLVAEVLLHRTRADQVVPLYYRLLAQYPTVAELAGAKVGDVRKILAAAGLVWRVDLLVEAAKAIVSRHNGDVPRSAEELQALPGVGHYIASAVRSFAYGEKDVIIDTNTVRIASRLIGFQMTDSSRRSRKVRQLLEDLVDPERARSINLAMLDFGALVCRAKRPLCLKCPLLSACTYGKRSLESEPARS
jgi:A/G-specific adenine glycosylase